MASKAQFAAVMTGSASPGHVQQLYDAAPTGLGGIGIIMLIFQLMTILQSTSFSKVVADLSVIVASLRAGTFDWAATIKLLGADAQTVYTLVQMIAAAFGLTLPPIPLGPIS